MASDVQRINAEGGALTEETLFVQVEKNKYRCTLCEKIVPKHHLSSHLHVHTGYKCNVCGKEYTRKSSLTKHMKTRDHVKRKLFECELCDKAFTRKCTLDIHLQLHQLYQGVYVCKECGKEFSQEMHLLDHMTKFRHHPTDVSASATTNQSSESPVTNDVESSESAKVFHLPFPNEIVGSTVCENDFPRTTVVSSLELPKVSLLPLPNALLAISTSGSELSRPYTFNKNPEVHKTSISAYPSELIGSSSAANDSDLLKITSYNHSDLLKLSSSLAPYSSFDTPSTSAATTNVYVTSASHARTQPSWTSGVSEKSYVEKMIYESSQSCEIENSKDLDEPEVLPSNANKHQLILPDGGSQVLLRTIAAGEHLGEEKQIVYNDIQQHPKQLANQEYTQILLKPIREDATGAGTNLIYNDVEHVNKMSTFHESQLLLKPVSQADNGAAPPSVHRTLVYSGIPHVNNLTDIQETPHMILIPISREQLTEAHMLDKRLVYGSAVPATSYAETTESSPATDTYQTSSSPSQEVTEDDSGDKQQILRNMLISNMMGSMHYTTTCQTLPGQTLVFDLGAATNGQDREVIKDHKRLFSSLSAAQTHGAVCPPAGLLTDGQEQHPSYEENRQSGVRVVDDHGGEDDSGGGGGGGGGGHNAVSKDIDIQTGHPRTVDAPKIPQMKYLAHMKKLNIASLQREVSNASLAQSVESAVHSKSTMLVEDTGKDGKDRVVEDVDVLQRLSNAQTQQQATFIYDYVPQPRSIADDGAKGLVVYVDQSSYIARAGLQQPPEAPATTELRLQAVEAAETNVDMTQVKLLPQFTDSDPERRDGSGTPNTESTYSSVHSYSEASLFNDTAPAGESAVVENGSTEESAANEPENTVGEERLGRKRVKKGGSSSSKRSKSDSGYKTYKCSSCDRYFPCASALERHRLNKHPPHVVCHTCSICGKALYHPSHVYIHMRTHV